MHKTFFIPVFLLTCTLIQVQTLYAVNSNDANNTIVQDVDEAHTYFDNEFKYKANVGSIKSALDRQENINIVDVRAVKAYKEGHIPSAINVPYTEWHKITEVTAESYGLRKNVINYVYCYTWDCNLALKAALKFTSLGYPIREVIGGFDAWKDHKYIIEK